MSNILTVRAPGVLSVSDLTYLLFFITILHRIQMYMSKRNKHPVPKRCLLSNELPALRYNICIKRKLCPSTKLYYNYKKFFSNFRVLSLSLYMYIHCDKNTRQCVMFFFALDTPRCGGTKFSSFKTTGTSSPRLGRTSGWLHVTRF